MKITLSGEDFRKLVQGEIVLAGKAMYPKGEGVKVEAVEIALQDIGFGVMRAYLDEAERVTREEAEKASSGNSSK